MDDARTAQVTAVAALAEPTRRRLYDHVVRQAGPVSRDEAAAATAVPRATAAFHLDRLVDDGLLDVVYERRTGRTGPGAGRPGEALPAGRVLGLGLPARAALRPGRRLLAAALAEADESGERPAAALERRAFDAGPRTRGAPRRGRPDGQDAVLRVLEEQGFEPRGGRTASITLANCPFHALAQEHTELVCGMNLRLLDGVLEGAPPPARRAAAARAGQVLRPAGAADDTA